MIRYIILIFIIIITYYKYCKDKDIEPFTVLNDYIPLWKDIDFKTECNNKMIDLKLKNFHIAVPGVYILMLHLLIPMIYIIIMQNQ